jgi:acetyltransferase-like isoleucine patch superfamily enzyme
LLKKIFSLCLPLVPPCEFKNALYRRGLGYRIGKKVRIGASWLFVERADLSDGVFIGKGNIIKGISSLVLGEGVFIGHFNRMVAHPGLYGMRPALKVGERTTITRDHFFDLTDSIEIGAGVVIGGTGSQFWTHGFDVERNRIQGEILIGDRCYVGSRALFNLGVQLGPETVIGAGAVVSRSFPDGGCFVAGNPARRIHDRVRFGDHPRARLLQNAPDGISLYGIPRQATEKEGR